MKEVISGLIAGLLAIAGQYVIVYELIEKPKIELENKKIALDAEKIALSFFPRVDSSCSVEREDNWDWKFWCESQNKGEYPMLVKIANVQFHQTSDRGRRLYHEGQGFKVVFPNNKDTFLAPPAATSSGVLVFHVIFDKDTYPQGQGEGLTALVTVQAESIKAQRDFMLKNFPDIVEILNNVSEQRSGIRVQIK